MRDHLDEYPYDDEDDAVCQRCEGQGCYHDCGEDVCCCDDSETDNLIECPDCDGTGIE